MLYKRIPEGESPFEALEPSFAGENRYAPFVVAIPVRQDGTVGIYRVMQNNGMYGTWRFPEGRVYPPRESENESIAAKVVKSAAVCVIAALGSQARINDPRVEAAPFVCKRKLTLKPQVAQHWPDAVGKIYLPAVTPVNVGTHYTPPHRLDVSWHTPEEGLAFLDEERSKAESHWDRSYTSLTYNTLRVSLETVTSVIGTKAEPHA